MPRKFVPVTDPEVPRCEQDEAKLMKHRKFDNPFLVYNKENNKRVFGGEDKYDYKPRNARTDGKKKTHKLVKNEKGLWVKQKIEEGEEEEKEDKVEEEGEKKEEGGKKEGEKDRKREREEKERVRRDDKREGRDKDSETRRKDDRERRDDRERSGRDDRERRDDRGRRDDRDRDRRDDRRSRDERGDKRQRVEEDPFAGGDVLESLSVDETNKLRAKLGLKPLK